MIYVQSRVRFINANFLRKIALDKKMRRVSQNKLDPNPLQDVWRLYQQKD